MKLSGFRREDSADATRVSATVAWEDSDRRAREVRAELPAELGPAVREELDGFAVAAAIVAQHHGERRLLVDGTLCPRLSEGLTAATRLLSRWFPPSAPAPAIECARGTAPRVPAPLPRAAVFLSGGVDSLFAVAQNRDRYPRDHPGSFRDAIVVEGFIFESPEGSARAGDYWRRTRTATSAFAAAAGLDALFVRTNLRELEDDIGFFCAKFHAAMLASVGHILSRRITSAAIAAGLDVAKLRPWGSHPVLDPLFSGSALAVFEAGIETPRVEKVGRIAAWPEALASLMVCTQGPLESGALNCGRCEKCVRTLVILGPSAARKASFERTDVAPAVVRSLRPGLHPWAVEEFWSENAAALRARGREDLAAAADQLVSRARVAGRWGLDRGWKGALRRLDRRFLGSALLRASRRLRNGGAA